MIQFGSHLSFVLPGLPPGFQSFCLPLDLDGSLCGNESLGQSAGLMKGTIVVRLPPLRFCSYSWDCNKQVWIICHTMSGAFFNRIGQKESKRYLYFTVIRSAYHDSNDYLWSSILSPGTKHHAASVACQDNGHQRQRALRSRGKVGGNLSWWGDAQRAPQVTELLHTHPKERIMFFSAQIN